MILPNNASQTKIFFESRQQFSSIAENSVEATGNLSRTADMLLLLTSFWELRLTAAISLPKTVILVDILRKKRWYIFLELVQHFWMRDYWTVKLKVQFQAAGHVLRILFITWHERCVPILYTPGRNAKFCSYNLWMPISKYERETNMKIAIKRDNFIRGTLVFLYFSSFPQIQPIFRTPW